MGITDELRTYAGSFYLYKDTREKLDAIADRIDAEYQKVIRELNNPADASALLPVDADGVPIRVGDVMKGETICGGFGEPFEVVGYIMKNGELEPMDKHRCTRKRMYLHHHHEPTVEDVLREFSCVLMGKREFNGDVAEAISEYAAKLRLVNDGEGQ